MVHHLEENLIRFQPVKQSTRSSLVQMDISRCKDINVSIFSNCTVTLRDKLPKPKLDSNREIQRVYPDTYNVVFLHDVGMASIPSSVMHLLKLLNNRYTIWTFDFRGHGDSLLNDEGKQQKISDVINYETITGDIHDFIITNKLKKIILVGHGLGSYFGLAALHEYPDLESKLAGLVMYGAHLDPTLDNFRARAIYYAKKLGLWELAYPYPEIYRALTPLLSMGVSDRLFREMIHRVSQEYAAVDKEAFLGLMEAASKDLSKDAKHPFLSVDIPMIFVDGERDIRRASEDSYSLRNYFPSAEFKTIPNLGHFLLQERPDGLLMNLNRILELIYLDRVNKANQ